MLLSDICRRADTGGILDSMLGSRVTSAFMSLRSSSSWFSTARARAHTSKCKEGGFAYAAIKRTREMKRMKNFLQILHETTASLK